VQTRVSGCSNAVHIWLSALPRAKVLPWPALCSTTLQRWALTILFSSAVKRDASQPLRAILRALRGAQLCWRRRDAARVRVVWARGDDHDCRLARCHL